MDELDLKIISLLRQDGTATNAGMARRVGVSEETVRRRLKRLVQEQYIRVVAVADPTRLGYKSEALVGLKVDADKTDSIADRLAELEEINWVSVTTGSFDVFVWATLRSPDALHDFLRTRVGTIPGVRKVETFISVNDQKRHYGVAI